MAGSPLFRPRSLRALGALLLAGGLAACIGAPPPPPATALAPGLVAPMDRRGAVLDSQAALSIVNQYRAMRGVPALSLDPTLESEARAMAAGYAASGRPPAGGAGRTLRLSAGYRDFANTFSGWRNSPPDADAMATPNARRAGLGVAYEDASTHGTHWVLLMAP